MRNYIRFIVRYRFVVLGFLLLVTVLAGGILSDVKIAGSMDKMLLGDSPRYYKYIERVVQFGADSFIIIAFEDDQLFSKQSLARLKKVIENIRNIRAVKRIRSILDLQDVQIVGGMPAAESYADIALREPERVDDILKKLGSDPLVSGLLLSKDGKHSLVVIELNLSGERSDKNIAAFLDKVLEQFVQAGFERAELHPGGGITLLGEMLKQTEFNIKRLFPIVCIVLFLTVYLLFQRLWPVFITLTVTLIGVSWTMAVTVLLFGEINILTAMTPGIIMIIAFSDVIHLCSAYHMEISKGEPKDQAILKSCSEVGAACFFTSVTTFFGFISMALLPAPVSRQMGVALGVGVGLSLMIAMTLTPIIFSLMKAPKALRVGATSKAQIMLYRLTDGIVRLTRNRPRIIVSAFAVILAFTILGVSRIQFETDIKMRLAPDNPFRVDAQYFEKHFDGTTYLDAFIESPEPGGILNSDLLSRVSELQERLTRIPEVDKTVSIRDIFAHLHRLFHPPDAAGRVPPMTDADAANYMVLLNMSGDETLNAMIDKEAKTLRIRMHLNESGFLTAHDVCQRAQEAGQAILGKTAKIEVTGIMALFGEWLTIYHDGQIKGLIFAFVTILIIMAIALRSVTGGLWSMLPNMIPLFILGGYVGWFWDVVDSDTLMVGIIAIGISVDDTIHFLFRYRYELEKARDMAIALDRTFYFSGRAIMIASIILVAGFLPFALSDYFSVRIMGTLLPLTLGAALLADLLLVPAMIKLGAFKFRFKA